MPSSFINKSLLYLILITWEESAGELQRNYWEDHPIPFPTILQGRGKFFRVCSSQADPTSLDGFPLYWVKEPRLTKPKTLDELNSADRMICHVLAGFGVTFSTVELIKHEYNSVELTKYIGMGEMPFSLTSILCFCLRPFRCKLYVFPLCFHNIT